MRGNTLSSRMLVVLFSCLVAIALCTFRAHAQQSSHANPAAGGLTYLTPGMPPVMIHPTVQAAETARGAAKGTHGGGGGGKGKKVSVNLFYNGGTGGIGVETSPKIFLVLWGSQWSSDPSGEEPLLVSFFQSVGGSTWSADDTQYCQGVPSGTYFCSKSRTSYTPAGNNIVFGGAWYDNTAAAPSQPSQPQIAAEAVRAEAEFVSLGDSFNPNTDQIVVATATGNNSPGFGTQYCAYHSYTTTSSGSNIAYTNLPYMTDAGAICGANFNGLGPDAGITIVEGQEMAETITDQFPNTGWLDASGNETGDKCAWISSGQGASADVTFPNGKVFPVQSLWSNVFHHNKGGCVLSYP